ncbi:hypothetical protein ACEPAF_5227 [Sanghuangporus sanghuang]
MNTSYTGVSTARPPPPSTAHTHGRSHSLSDPRSLHSDSSALAPSSDLCSSTLEFYDSQSITPDWQRATLASARDSTYPSPDPGSVSSANGNEQPHVTHCVASPQSMVSSGSPKGGSPVTPSSSIDTAHPTPRTTGKKPSIDRNPKPCGACSSSKRKCKPIPGVPNLCERCKNNGLTECPPHISWTTRKQSMADGGSLSPLDVDESAFSSRSASPSYIGAGRSPVGYPAGFQNPNEHGAYADMSTTQEWVQAQTQAEANSNTIDLGAYDTRYTPQAQQPVRGQGISALHIVPHCAQNNQSLSPPLHPVCHVCNTPYDEYLMLSYAMAHLSSIIPSPPYELDQSLLKAYGHIPPQDPYDSRY